MRSVEICLLEKERGNSGRNRTIKMILGYATNNKRERERERERESNKSVKKQSIVRRTVRTMFGGLKVRLTLNSETKSQVRRTSSSPS